MSLWRQQSASDLITLLELQQDECGCRTFVWITIKRWPTEAKLLMSDHKAKLNVAVNYLQDIYRGGRLLLFFQETQRWSWRMLLEYLSTSRCLIAGRWWSRNQGSEAQQNAISNLTDASSREQRREVCGLYSAVFSSHWHSGLALMTRVD